MRHPPLDTWPPAEHVSTTDLREAICALRRNFDQKKEKNSRRTRVAESGAKSSSKSKRRKKNPAKRHACENKKEFLEIYDLKDTHDDFQHTHDTINTK